ncbi:MAG: DUF2971 domain-containing protein [Burkholderiales bacterium]|nr:DUF2971 domain-containing protein [Burkholderiales bacterium]
MQRADSMNAQGDELAGLRREVSERQAAWVSAWLSRQGEPPRGILYHYTTAAGLLGILASGKFWATHLNYLNDPTELDYGVGLVRGALHAEANRRKSGAVAALLATTARNFNPFGLLNAYAVCFCEQGDQLSQWRGYGNTGGGYALGVAPRAVAADLPPEPKISLRRVVYDRTEQSTLIEDSVRAFAMHADGVFEKRWPIAIQEEAATILRNAFRQEVGDFLWCFKNPGFHEEREWRFVYITGPVDPAPMSVCFRPSQDGVVPYVELDLFLLRQGEEKHLGISEVVCGPTLHPLHGQSAVRMAISAYGYKDVAVRQSVVPLRA